VLSGLAASAAILATRSGVYKTRSKKQQNETLHLVTWNGGTDELTGTSSPGVELERLTGIELESLLTFL
jgi:hypothetical protein